MRRIDQIRSHLVLPHNCAGSNSSTSLWQDLVAARCRPVAGEGGKYEAEIAKELCWGENIYEGGYAMDLTCQGGAVMALALDCTTRCANDGRYPHPLTATAIFVGRATPGPCQVSVDMLKRGRTMAQATTRLEQNGKPVLAMTSIFGTLPSDETSTLQVTD